MPSYLNITPGTIQNVIAADINQDGNLDLITTAEPGVSVSLGSGTGSFGLRTDFAGGKSVDQLSVADINGDGRPDILGTDYFHNEIIVLLNNGDGTFALLNSPPVSFPPTEVRAADMNGDGKVDLIASQTYGISILIGNGNGTFQAEQKVTFAAVSGDRFVIDDFDGNSTPDIAINSGSNIVTVLLNDGRGNLREDSSWPGGISLKTIDSADLDGDGKRDLVIGFSDSSNGYTKILYNVSQPKIPSFVSVVGKVVRPDGSPLRYAVVTMIDSQNTRRTVLSNSFGLYSFSDVATNSAYTVMVSSKQFRFSPKSAHFMKNTTMENFVGAE